MVTRRRSGLLAVVATMLMASATLALVGASPAHAVTGAAFGEIVVDDVGRHVFVTSGDAVAVFDLDGTPVGSIGGQTGVTDLLLRGRTLYVLAAGAGRINVVDSDLLTVTGGWSVATTARPRSLAFSAGKLWYTYGDQWSGGLASLDPRTGVVSAPLADNLYARGEIVGSDSPSRIYVLDTGLSPSKVHAYDVTTNPPTLLMSSPHSNACSNGSELVLSIDATKAWTACGAPYLINEFDTATLAEPVVHYPAEPYPVAVDRSADGRYLVGGTSSPYDPDIFIYEVGRPVIAKSIELGRLKELANGMLAISGDGSRIFAVTDDGQFHVWNLAPVVSSIDPGEVPARTEAPITLYGSGLSEITSVRIGGVEAPFVVVSDGAVQVIAPSLPRGSYPVVVTSRWGSNPPTAAARLRVVGRGHLPIGPSVPPIPPGPSAHDPFASLEDLAFRQYLDFLGRRPSIDELEAVLRDDSARLGELIADLRRGADATDNVDPVTRLYFAALLRTPDAPGVSYWIAQKRAGTSLGQISDALVASPEFEHRYGSLSNQAFIDRTYRNVLGRAADPGGQRYWNAQLRAHLVTRGRILVAMAESTSFRATHARAVDVAVLYAAMLGRAPSTSELASGIASLEAGGTVADLATDLSQSPSYAVRIAALQL